MRILHVLNALLIIGIIAFSLQVYPELPERIPRHFSADGTPDRWSERTPLSWLMLPLIGIGSAALMYVIGALIPARPQLVNLPDKKKLLELPPHLQRGVLREAAGLMYATTSAMLVMFALIQYGVYESAVTGGRSDMISAALIVSLVAMPFVFIIFIVRFQRKLDRAVAQARASNTHRFGNGASTTFS